jgi:hypothetical protein
VAGDGTQKNVTISEVSSQPPGEFGDKKSYKVKTTEGDVIQIVLPKDAPPPKKDESVFGTQYPPKEGTSFPPSFYPSKGKGGGGGGFKGKTEREIKSDEARSALIRATDLVIADKIPVSDVPKITREFYAVLKELAA